MLVTLLERLQRNELPAGQRGLSPFWLNRQEECQADCGGAQQEQAGDHVVE